MGNENYNEDYNEDDNDIPTNETSNPSTESNIQFQPKPVNIIKELLWTTSNYRNSDKIPRIELTEYRQSMSASIMNYIYKIKGIAQDIEKTREKAKIFSETVDKLTKAETRNSALTNVTDIIKAANMVNTNRQVIGNVYDGLYQAELTGNHYVFPFINTGYNQHISNGWGDASKKGGSVGEKIMKTMNEISGALNFLEPTVQSEPVYEYSPNSPDSYAITFKLYNTFDEKYISKHLEFIYRFKYQNLHLRKTVNTLMPPCIYSVSIPGIKNSPIAVVERFTVKNEGICRLLTVDNVFEKSVQSVVPDVYDIEIHIKDLFFDSQNIFSSIMDNSQKIVQVLPAK